MTERLFVIFRGPFVQCKQQGTFLDALERSHVIFQILNYQAILILFNSNKFYQCIQLHIKSGQIYMTFYVSRIILEPKLLHSKMQRARKDIPEPVNQVSKCTVL